MCLTYKCIFSAKVLSSIHNNKLLNTEDYADFSFELYLEYRTYNAVYLSLTRAAYISRALLIRPLKGFFPTGNF